MTKMTLLGQNQNDLVDCTEVIPVPKPNNKATTFPAGQNARDLQLSVCLFVVVCFVVFLTFGLAFSATVFHSPLLLPIPVQQPLFLQLRALPLINERGYRVWISSLFGFFVYGR